MPGSLYTMKWIQEIGFGVVKSPYVFGAKASLNWCFGVFAPLSPLTICRGAVGYKTRNFRKTAESFNAYDFWTPRPSILAVFILGIMHKGLCFPTKHLENHLKQFFMRCSHHEIQGELNETFIITFV